MRILFLALTIIVSSTLLSSFVMGQAVEPWTEEEPESFYPPILPYHSNDPMHFYVVYERPQGFFSARYWIAAEGMITKDTPGQFESFLKNDPNVKKANAIVVYINKLKAYLKKDPHEEHASTIAPRIDKGPEGIYIHSCGGDEEAAVQLGRLFKKHQLIPYIGQTHREPDHHEIDIANGECRGACILAALSKPKTTLLERKGLDVYDLGGGKTRGIGEYIPITIPVFSTPQDRLLRYAQSQGVDKATVQSLFPKIGDEPRMLSLAEGEKLGLSFRYFPYRNVAPEYYDSCP